MEEFWKGVGRKAHDVRFMVRGSRSRFTERGMLYDLFSVLFLMVVSDHQVLSISNLVSTFRTPC